MSRSREKVNYLKKILRKNSIIMQNSEIFFIEIHLFLGFYKQTVIKNEKLKSAFYHSGTIQVSLLSLEKQQNFLLPFSRSNSQ